MLALSLAGTSMRVASADRPQQTRSPSFAVKIVNGADQQYLCSSTTLNVAKRAGMDSR
jgi:hypothetical protein